MEFEDSRFALFPEPNAYIQNFNKPQKETKKIVFAEPYETLPQFYINNNFQKHNCNCDQNNSKHNLNCDYDNLNKSQNKSGCGFNCNKGYNNFDNEHDCKCNHDNKKQNGFNFDLKNLMPLLGMFNKSGGADLSNLVGLLNNKQQTENNPMNLISNLMSNKDMMSGILNLFKGGGLNLFGKSKPVIKEIKTTDFEIKNYTRVE